MQKQEENKKDNNDVKIDTYQNTLNKNTKIHVYEKEVIPTSNNLKEDEIIKEKDKKEIENPLPNKRIKIFLILIASISAVLVIGAILLIGYFCGGWFQYKQDLIIDRKRNERMVTRYLETKQMSNYYDIENLEESKRYKNTSISTEFIVGINSKKRMKYFGEIDYLYEALILVLNMSATNEEGTTYLGGINIFDSSKSIEELIELNTQMLFNSKNESMNQNDETDEQSKLNKTNQVPFSKFYFYENGTLGDIYVPEELNEFYKITLEDLIKKITPKLSKSLYNNQDAKRRLESGGVGTYLKYENVYKNGKVSNIVSFEDTKEKDLDKDQDQDSKDYTFEDSELDSKMKRTFNSTSGEMTSLEMEGSASFKSIPTVNQENEEIQTNEENEEKELNSNCNYTNLGMNEFKTVVTSNMQLLKNSIEPETLKNLNKLYSKYNFEKINHKYTIFKSSEGNVTENETNNNETINQIKENIIENQTRMLASFPNFKSSYKINSDLLDIKFLGLKVKYGHKMEINKKTGLRLSSTTVRLGKTNNDILKVLSYQTKKNINNYKYKNANRVLNGVKKCFNVFGYRVCLNLNLEFNIFNHIYTLYRRENYSQSYSKGKINVVAQAGVDLFLINIGLGVRGHIAEGDSYIQANTLSQIRSKKSLVIFEEALSSGGVSLFFYTEIGFWKFKKRWEVDFKLFSGFSWKDAKKKYV